MRARSTVAIIRLNHSLPCNARLLHVGIAYIFICFNLDKTVRGAIISSKPENFHVPAYSR